MADKVKKVTIYKNGTWQDSASLGADAANVDIADSNNSFVAINVEDALSELKSSTVMSNNGIHGLKVYKTISGTTTKYNLQVYDDTDSSWHGFSNDDNSNVNVKIVTWADGTDQEIADMVAAADAGTINLADYWAVGDQRTVSLNAMNGVSTIETHSAQQVTWVLVANCASANSNNEKINANDSNSYQLVSATSSGRTIPSFIIGQKKSLATEGYMNPTNTNSGSWNGCARRTWCNNQYYNAIPTTLRAILKQVKVATISEYSSSTMKYSDDYIFLNAAKEIFGGAGRGNFQYSNTTESSHLVQLSYYETSSHRIKYQGSTSNAYQWWNRSPHYNSSSYFCGVNSGGSAHDDSASHTNGLAPCGCV